MEKTTPEYVVKYIASIAVRNEDTAVLLNLVRQGHADIVKEAIKNYG